MTYPRHCERLVRRSSKSEGEAIPLHLPEQESWIASAFALRRFGKRQARRSLRSKRRRVVACAPRNDGGWRAASHVQLIIAGELRLVGDEGKPRLGLGAHQPFDGIGRTLAVV